MQDENVVLNDKDDGAYQGRYTQPVIEPKVAFLSSNIETSSYHRNAKNHKDYAYSKDTSSINVSHVYQFPFEVV